MKRKRYIWLEWLFLLVLQSVLFSCGEEALEWELDISVPDILIVEGVITNERRAHEIRITRPVADPSAIPEPVTGALVAIVDGTPNPFYLTEISPGIYHTDSTFRAVFNRLYTLYIANEGKEYTARSYLTRVLQLYPVQYRRAPNQPDWYELVLRETADASMIEIWLDWSHLPQFRGQPSETTRARIVYYTVKSIDVNKMFKPDKERVFFPAGTRVVRRKYSMNTFQEEFVRTLMAETEWRGWLFDVQPGNVQTNLTEGAVGYFSASQVLADSTIITPL